MTQSPRTSELASRHRALGSDLEDWNGMGTAWSYQANPNDEHDAVRETAGIFDMSPLKKVYLRGPDAARVADHVITRDMTRICPGKSAYGAILTEQGTVCDDAIIANINDNEWLVCHGSGETYERLQESAQGLNVSVEFDDDLHNISVQGPQSLALLNPHASDDLSGLEYFHHQPARLFGLDCRISRTGYSGEKGYELFVDRSSVCELWDSLLDAGKTMGVMPCSFTALDKVRIEAALLFFGYDMTAEHSPWEVGLGFTVSKDKGDFRGKNHVYVLRGQERFKLAGIEINHDDALAGGEKLMLNNKEVGVVNSPGYSHRLGKSLALVHLHPDATPVGTELDVIGDGEEYKASVAQIPFYDAGKTKVRE